MIDTPLDFDWAGAGDATVALCTLVTEFHSHYVVRADHAGSLVFELSVTQGCEHGGKLADEGLELHTLATLDQTLNGHTGPRWVLSFRHFVLPRGKKKRGLDPLRCRMG